MLMQLLMIIAFIVILQGWTEEVMVQLFPRLMETWLHTQPALTCSLFRCHNKMAKVMIYCFYGIANLSFFIVKTGLENYVPRVSFALLLRFTLSLEVKVQTTSIDFIPLNDEKTHEVFPKLYFGQDSKI